MAEDTSAKAFIKATIRAASLTKQEAIHIRREILESLNIPAAAKDLKSLEAVLLHKHKPRNARNPDASKNTWVQDLTL
jgi:hypothetical protein